MPPLKGSQTEKNLLVSFAGESQARNRYTFFAKQAKKDGLELVSAIFTETAEHEKVHAKRYFTFLEGGEVEITAAFPAGKVGSTLDNLREAAAGERFENTVMYPGFAKIAREEGFADVALAFERVAEAEQYHEARYTRLVALIEAGAMFKRDTAVRWRCRHCGWNFIGFEPPAKCPTCLHPQAWFEPFAEDWIYS